MRGDDVAALAGGDQLSDQGGQRLGKGDGDAAEGDGDGVAIVVDVLDGEPGDRGDALGVGQEQQPGDPIRDREGVVVEEPPGIGPAFLGVVRPGGVSGSRRRSGRGHAYG